jgi:hypothetical protein
VGEESRSRSDFGKRETNVVFPTPIPLPDSVLYYGDEEPDFQPELTDDEKAYCAGEWES